eukprot:2530499-Amphidinium_carterae.1
MEQQEVRSLLGVSRGDDCRQTGPESNQCNQTDYAPAAHLYGEDNTQNPNYRSFEHSSIEM